MAMVAHKTRRRLLGIIAVLNWLIAVGTFGFTAWWATPDKRLEYHGAMLFALAIAAVATVIHYISGALTPVEIAFRLGRQVGFDEGHRQARPVLVPERRLQERRDAHHLRN